MSGRYSRATASAGFTGRGQDIARHEQAEAWTSALREQQQPLDLGADLGPADPTAYTMRRPIPERFEAAAS